MVYESNGDIDEVSSIEGCLNKIETYLIVITKMKKSHLTYDRVRVFYYKLHKISINRGGSSYIDSPDWIKYKKQQ